MGFSVVFICYIIIWSAAFSSWAGSYSLCPSICACKWKSGKQTAECIGQGLTAVPTGLNAGTQVIDLSRNSFETLTTHIFHEKGLVNLQKIYLGDCGVSSIEPEAFFQLSNLVELDLSANELSAIPAEALYDCSHLRRLQLSQNPIKYIGDDVFLPLSRLTFLDLSKCGIETIETKAFNGLKKLEFLKLDGNKLEDMPVEIVEPLDELSGLYLHNNPWNCDCNLRSFRKWMIDQNVPLAVPPLCSQPKHAKGTTWDVMTLDDFACPPTIIAPSVREESVPLHQNASILCQVDSVPRASIYWEVGGKYLTNISSHPDLRWKYGVDTYDTQNPLIQSSRLHIIDLSEADGDVYTCIAENKAGNSTLNFTIVTISPFPTEGFLSTTHIIILTVAVIAVVLVALIVVFVYAFHPITMPWRKTGGGVSILMQLKSKNQEAVEMHDVSVEKEEKEFKVADKHPRLETGSSGYGSDQLTPDLVSKIGDTTHGPSLSTSTVSCGHPEYDNSVISEVYGAASDHWPAGRAKPPRYDDSPGRSLYSEIYPNPCYGADDPECFVTQSPIIFHHVDFHAERYVPQNDRVRTLRSGFECSGPTTSSSDAARDDLYVGSGCSASWKRSPLSVSGNMGHYTLATKARFSPDEGYAEEALEGTEV